ncbi:histidine kinase [Thermanaeromonas sp. C210]|nr:histidine kinase [Thermanaeromonas sp. C210]
MRAVLDASVLDHILKETVEALERSRSQIHEIAENAQAEVRQVSRELEEVKKSLQAVIEEVDRLERAEKRARLRLAEVSKDFYRYKEQDIKEAYDAAYQLQIELIKLRDKEKILQYRRNHLERSWHRLQLTVQKAEQLASQVNVILNYLTGELQGLSLKLDELQQTQQLVFSIIRAQEEERKRVAREIHDGPAQSLAHIALRAEYCLQLLNRDPDQIREELHALQNVVSLCLQDMRKIIFDLRPMVLDDIGLVPALERYFATYKEQHGLEVDFLFLGQERRLDNTLEVALFRIIQEAVNNIRKHAGVKRAVVKVEMLPNRISIGIRDEGKGFDLEAVRNREEGRGYGLMGMRERVQLLKGEMKITTAPGKGTNISITIPLDKESKVQPGAAPET